MGTSAWESGKAADAFLRPSHEFGPCLEKASEEVGNVVRADEGGQTRRGQRGQVMEIRTRAGSIEVDYQTRDYNNLYLGYLYKCGVW